jgi:hypothetical protein
MIIGDSTPPPRVDAMVPFFYIYKVTGHIDSFYNTKRENTKQHPNFCKALSTTTKKLFLKHNQTYFTFTECLLD